MQVEVNGTRLWFDVDGPALVPDGRRMRERPTVILVHGGPASYDHSYFKSGLPPLSERAQVVYLDLRDHGRSGRNDPEASRGVVAALAPGIGRLEVIEGAGHFPWLDVPDRFLSVIGAFVDDVTAGRA